MGCRKFLVDSRRNKAATLTSRYQPRLPGAACLRVAVGRLLNRHRIRLARELNAAFPSS
jgi:hypothetical protein